MLMMVWDGDKTSGINDVVIDRLECLKLVVLVNGEDNDSNNRYHLKYPISSFNSFHSHYSKSVNENNTSNNMSMSMNMIDKGIISKRYHSSSISSSCHHKSHTTMSIAKRCKRQFWLIWISSLGTVGEDSSGGTLSCDKSCLPIISFFNNENCIVSTSSFVCSIDWCFVSDIC